MATFPIGNVEKWISKSTHPRHRHAALVLRGGAVLAVGANRNGRHAEVVALSKLWPDKRNGVTLVSLRMNSLGQLAMAMPCKDCQEFCKQSGVSRIYYSNRAGELEMMEWK